MQPKMEVYATSLMRAGVGKQGVERWLREGGTHNEAVAELAALAT
jgi:hypothetical protein